MKITLNDIILETSIKSLFALKEKHAPDSDVTIYNGFPVKTDCQLKNNDEIVFITKGIIPTADEMESLMVARHTPGVHKKVKTATVAIAGLGGLGSNVAVMLARLGVGKLLLLDFDVVEPSNLNRQHYFIHQIGMTKTEAMIENLKVVNPYINVEAHHVFFTKDNLHLFDAADIIVEAFDVAETKALIVNEVLSQYRDKYMVAASGLAGYFSNNTIVTKRITDQFYMIGDGVNAAQEGCGLMAPRAMLAAAHQANTVLRIIMGDLGV